MTTVGDGVIAAIYGPLGTVYAQTHAPETGNVIGAIIRQIYTPRIEVESPPTVEAVWRRKNGHNILHLLNASGMQLASDYSAIDYVPPAGPVEVRLSPPVRPREVSLEPARKLLEGSWRDGIWSATNPSLRIHSMLVW